MRRVHRIASLTALALSALAIAACQGNRASAEADWSNGQGHGVVLLYHHVADDTPASTSVTPERFAEHVNHLRDNDFTVWPLPDLIEAVRNGDEVPPRTVAISFDDAYASVYDHVFPKLQALDWPFTVFVSTQYIDDGLRNYNTWDELREMERAGVTIANHGRSHAFMAHPAPDESERDWLARMRAEVEDAQARLEAELEQPARLFAWPYGEYSPRVQEMLRELGYVGIAQRSGAVGRGSDFTALPRYPMATGFDDMDSFALKVRSRPLPVASRSPESGVLDAGSDSAAVEFTLAEGNYRLDALQCYMGGQALEIERLNEDPPRLRIENDRPLRIGRAIYNCTAPATDANVWYWHSFLWMRPRDDGSWYEG